MNNSNGLNGSKGLGSLGTRILSAIIALSILFAAVYFFGAQGLKLVVTFVVAIGIYELLPMLQINFRNKLTRLSYYFLFLSVFILNCQLPNLKDLFFSVTILMVCALALIKQRHSSSSNLQSAANFISMSCLGLFYIGVLPSFVYQILDQPQGVFWFLSLLFVVFAGDVFAYFFGLFFGRHKLLETVSPKKTIEGAIGGLLGSILVGGLCAYFLLDASIFSMLVISLLAGVFAQFGDLFESLLKRIADIKDSGQIMPGHGGVLDRIDGVLFASPIFLIASIILQKYHS